MIIHLHNWRCFSSHKFDLPFSSAVIVDKNGSGKTSLLSALYTLTTGAAWPDTKLLHHLKSQSEYFGISTHNPEWSFTGKVNPSGRISTKLNQPDNFAQCVFSKTESSTQANMQTPAVFTYLPVDNYVFNGSRSQVVAFIDELIAQQQGAAYRKLLAELAKIVFSKQKLIKHTCETSTNPDAILVHTLNEKLLTISTQIWHTRSQFLSLLQTSLPTFCTWVQSPLRNWEVGWQIAGTFGRHNKVCDFTFDNVTLSSLNNLFKQECAAGRVLWGAQRDEIQITSSHLSIQNTLSRGEMRLFILFIKYTAMQQIFNREVWFFLDDVFNEFDNEREQIVWQKILKNIPFYLATSTRAPSFQTPTFSLAQITAKN